MDPPPPHLLSSYLPTKRNNMEESPPYLALGPRRTAPPLLPLTSPLPPQASASPRPPARPQRRAATRALISLSKGYIPLSLDSSSCSSDSDPGTPGDQTIADNESVAAAQGKASTGEKNSGKELAHRIERLSGHDNGAGATAGIADSDGDSDGYVAGREGRRGAKRKQYRSTGGKRKMMKLDRDDWKVIAGAREGTDGKKIDTKAKKRKKASTLEGVLTREEMGNLLGFVSAELDWAKAALVLGGGEDGAVERGVKGKSEENEKAELQQAGKDEDAKIAKSGDGLKRCWNTELTARLLGIYK